MGYAFRCDRPLEREVRRIADHQLALAITRIPAWWEGPGDCAVHDARRHVKKVRALAKLVRPRQRGSRAINRRLREVSRLLGPIVDHEATVTMLGRLAARYPGDVSPRAVRTLQRSLARRGADIARQCEANGTLHDSIGMLLALQPKVQSWRLPRHGVRAIAPGLARGLRRLRRATTAAESRPSARRYHVWRERVKDHWFHVRLIESRCGDHFVAYEHSLERLDGVLGEYHNCVLLQQLIVGDSHLRRGDAAGLLRVIRRYQRELRAQARQLVDSLSTQSVEEFMAEVRDCWRARRSNAPPVAETPGRGSWAQAA